MERIFLLLWWLFVDLSRSTSISFLLCFDRCFDSEVWRKILFSIPTDATGTNVDGLLSDQRRVISGKRWLGRVEKWSHAFGKFCLTFCSQKSCTATCSIKKNQWWELWSGGTCFDWGQFETLLDKTRSRVKKKKTATARIRTGDLLFTRQAL